MRFPPALRREVLAEVEPSPDLTRRARRVAQTLVARIEEEARRRGLAVQPRLVGSLHKATHLATPLDLDVFVLFPPATSRADLERHGIDLGKAVLERSKLRYAEHPYVHGESQGFAVDVVPAYRIRTIRGRLSAVDRSPLHARYVRRHLRPEQRNEVRLLKRFLRGVGCYGAETATGGVSGYLAELLVLKFGTFPRTIDAMAAWKQPIQLSLEDQAPDLGGPLVFVDPVDENRNAAAAVRPETLDRLIRAARAFRRRPRRAFFFPNEPRPLPRAALARLLAKDAVLGLDVPEPPGREETTRPQGLRLAAKFARALHESGFRVRHNDVFAGAAGRLLLLCSHEPRRLPERFEHRGPRAGDDAHVERFVRKWKGREEVVSGPRVAGGRWTVQVRRDQRTPAEVLGVRVPHLLLGFGYGESQVRSARLLEGRALLDMEAFRLPLTLFLRRLDPWDF